MKEMKDVSITLDVVLSVPAKTTAEAYEKLTQMQTLKRLKTAIEQCQFEASKFETKH